MTKLELYSEPFAKTGNISGEGFQRLLGKPTLGLLQTVIRESLQNSLDAAAGESGPDIVLRIRTLSSEEMEVLNAGVVTSLPADNGNSEKLLKSAVSGESLLVFEICDFGTSGLGGPIRADMPVSHDEDPDFVNFIRNVGAARDTHHGGGTYGYGKTSLYAMSACATIVVDSVASHHGKQARRLIGCHLGDAYDEFRSDGSGLRYTGRHWWGVPDGSEGIDPLEGDEATELSRALGMPKRSPDDTGTTVMILDPRFNDAGQIKNELIEAVLWNFWPRMTETTPHDRRLKVTLEIENEEVVIPRPEDFPPLDLFSQALADLRAQDEKVKTIQCGRPKKKLGKLAVRMGAVASRHETAHREGSGIPSQCGMIALMRPVELVVKYLQGELLADERYEWAGVFRCSDDDDVEEAFAAAEPPAHDDWIPDNLPRGTAKTWVKTALRKLREEAGNYATPKGGLNKPGQSGPSMARTASLLGSHLVQSSAQGPGKAIAAKGGSRNGGGGVRKTGLTQPVFVSLNLGADGKPVSIFRASLRNAGDDPQLTISADPYLVADGGSTTFDDLDTSYMPVIHEMKMVESGKTVNANCMEVGTDGGDVEVSVSMPREAAVGLRISIQNSSEV